MRIPWKPGEYEDLKKRMPHHTEFHSVLIKHNEKWKTGRTTGPHDA